MFRVGLTRLGLLLPDLSRDVWWLIFVNAAMQVIFNFVSIFVNLYWWRQGDPIFTVSLFNLFGTVALFLSYAIGSYFLWRQDIRFVMVLSGLMAGLTFVGLFFYDPRLQVAFIIGVGLCFGLTQGFFWAANNASMYTVLPSEQWADYFSMNTVIGQGIAVVIPLASAGAVSWLGFRGAFLAMLGVVGAALGLAARLPRRRLSDNLYTGLGFRQVFSRPGTPWLLVVVLASGLANQFLALFSMVYIFTTSTQAGIVAVLNIGFSLVLLGALVLYRRSQWRQEWWLVAGVGFIWLSYAISLTVGRGATDIIVVLMMRVGGLYLTAASGRQRYRVMMQGDVVWRTRLGLWMEVPFAVSRVLILAGALLVTRVGDTPFVALMLVSVLAMIALPILTGVAVARFEAVHGVSAGL
ncbi:MAG: hypothetical protein C7B45_06375 [Sulfobacillus acidophilus]|uniref:MFS transporter n=1 Tax=Sulfobacillus acidophilus TaxID=53633 RepID=A0A2T2WJX5_9FIRM|nr:MAG: hypothetical protein C7B45_06375 [Sulfobacillus acidophilus]